MLPAPHLFPMGDQALIIEFGDRVDPVLSARIATLAQRLRESLPIGVLDIVPAYSTLALHYDPAAVGSGTSPYEALAEIIGNWLQTQSVETSAAGRLVEIPVCYGGTFGEDLEALARMRNLSVEQVIAIHGGTDYHVHMLGFVPGFAYLGGLMRGWRRHAATRQGRACRQAVWASAANRRACIRWTRPAAGRSSAARHCSCSSRTLPRQAC